MHRTARQHDRSGFSLVEVLVVVAIIGVLMGLVAGGLSMAKSKAERVKVATQVAELKAAWEAYRLEYQRFPQTERSSMTEMGPEAVAILRGDMIADNPQGNTFLDFRSGATEYKDKWRHRFQFRLDYDYDGVVSVPGHGSIRTSVAVWSTGKNVGGTDAADDDICSWDR